MANCSSVTKAYWPPKQVRAQNITSSSAAQQFVIFAFFSHPGLYLKTVWNESTFCGLFRIVAGRKCCEVARVLVTCLRRHGVGVCMFGDQNVSKPSIREGWQITWKKDWQLANYRVIWQKCFVLLKHPFHSDWKQIDIIVLFEFFLEMMVGTKLSWA